MLSEKRQVHHNRWLPFAARDLLIAGAALVAVQLSPQGEVAQFSTGLLLALCAYLFHEWAHLLAARLLRANIEMASSLLSPFLFSFDSTRNSTSVFLHMSWPGFVATALYLLAFALWLPEDALWGQTAMIGALLLAGATVVLEGPLFVWALVTGKIPPVEIPGIGNNRVLAQLKRLIPG